MFFLHSFLQSCRHSRVVAQHGGLALRAVLMTTALVKRESQNLKSLNWLQKIIKCKYCFAQLQLLCYWCE